jgi:hypothetical protein
MLALADRVDSEYGSDDEGERVLCGPAHAPEEPSRAGDDAKGVRWPSGTENAPELQS